ncbi:MAG: hypothetical protein ACKOD5_13325, partial [Chthoniobacterales bacterium]
MHRAFLSGLLAAVLAVASGCSWLPKTPKWAEGWLGLVKKNGDAPEATLPTWWGRVVWGDAD